MNQHSAEVLSNIIRERRSVKTNFFKANEKIPDKVIEEALVNATWAPTHGKTEPWYFIVFTGEGIKHLCTFQAELYKAESGEKFTEAKYQKLKEDYQKASHVIAICLRRDITSKIPEIEEIAAVAAAVQNLALTIHAYGFGGYWTTGGITYYSSAKSFFGLKESDKLMGFYLCGAVAETPVPTTRKSIKEKTKWVSSAASED